MNIYFDICWLPPSSKAEFLPAHTYVDVLSIYIYIYVYRLIKID